MVQHIYEKVYFKSPAFIQNILISIYGAKLWARRYRPPHKKFCKELGQSQWLDRDQISVRQRETFLELVEHAFMTVPFYKQWQEKSGVSIRDITSVDNIIKLPIIEKDQIRENPKRFCSEEYFNKYGTFWLNTSGTSGKPLQILCDNHSRRFHYAFWQRFRKWHGIPPSAKRATFFGRIIILPHIDKPPFWRYDFFGNNILFSSYHLSESNLPYYCDKLLEISPVEIIGYPSSLALIAKYIKKNDIKGISPKCVITTAEMLLSHQRKIIEDAFSCKVADQYGCTEMAFFCSQCEYETYHINPEHGIVEVVNSKNVPVEVGNIGEAVCTGFVNMAMPLIRYKVGDQIAISSKTCQCGRAFPVVKEITGRLDDMLFTPYGRPLGRLDPVFKGLSGIFETQIIQKDLKTLEVKMVVDSSFTKKNEEEFIYELRKRTGPEMDIEINFVDGIPKDKNGKFRTVISMIRSTDF